MKKNDTKWINMWQEAPEFETFVLASDGKSDFICELHEGIDGAYIWFDKEGNVVDKDVLKWASLDEDEK